MGGLFPPCCTSTAQRKCAYHFELELVLFKRTFAIRQRFTTAGGFDIYNLFVHLRRVVLVIIKDFPTQIPQSG